MTSATASKPPYEMKFDVGTIKHLGLQMYSTLPPVIGELVANAWDANATRVEITIPEGPLSETATITIADNGIGMSDTDIRTKYIITGRDRRSDDRSDRTPRPLRRRVMGRKGIGKFSSFGIAEEIEIESIKNGEASRLVMNYHTMLDRASSRTIDFPALEATGDIQAGSRFTLRSFIKFKTKSVPIGALRRGLARRFSIIGANSNFEVIINGRPISPEERDLRTLLDKDDDGNPYIWNYNNEPIAEGAEWTVSGWIGALKRTSPQSDNVDRGVALMARGKLVQEPFVFDAVVGQQYALSYIIGELHVEFVDEKEDTIGTNRNALVWDTEANTALKAWGRGQVNKIAREWAERRSNDNQKALEKSEIYREFKKKADELGKRRARKLADQLVRQSIQNNPTALPSELRPIIQMSLDFLEFDAFAELASELVDADVNDAGAILELFREWQVVEAMEMTRVAKGRIATIEKLQNLIDRDALEVPTLHGFLKEFPWVIDPRWTMVDDEVQFTQLLREKFKEPPELPEKNRRIDFLCVREGRNLVIVEIKRPSLRASSKELNQIEEQVNFARHRISKTTDAEMRYSGATGYLLCGDMVDSYQAAGKRDNLATSGIYVRLYSDLLEAARRVHRELIARYEQLKKIANR